MAQVNDAAEVIYDLVDAQANLIFGAVVDPAMKNGEVRRTMHALLRSDVNHCSSLKRAVQNHRCCFTRSCLLVPLCYKGCDSR